MFTVIVFWQDKEIKKEHEWVIKKNDTEIEILFLDQMPDIEKLKEDILRVVNTRTQWRLFFIDNYGYQCIHFGKNLKCNKCCCCNAAKKQASSSVHVCNKAHCGMGRNPYADSYGKKIQKEEQHRKDLIHILNAIGDYRNTAFMQPKDFFVITVRAGEFICVQKDRIANLSRKYWTIGQEFPQTCRYLIYDISGFGKKIYVKEEFKFYCLISVLAHSELRIRRFHDHH